MMSITTSAGGRAGRRRMTPACESLEGRRLLAGDPGYVLSGFKWPDPSHISYSFPPDGVTWDAAPNILNAALTAKFGDAWKREIARALQTWASVANINIVSSGDVAAGFDAPGRAQGDPRFGDIRIAGYDFGNRTTLAQTYYPPPDGLTAAGDSALNTGVDFRIGGDYDLYSVMLHEMGHALGLEHSHDPTAVMAAVYAGVRAGLTPADVAGIQALYGPRTFDGFQARGFGTSAVTAIDLTGALDASGQETVHGLSLTRIGDYEYFRVVAPASATSLQVTAVAGGVSLLSPAVGLYDAAGNPVAGGLDPSSWGDNVTAAGRIAPGQAYYVMVGAATRDVFAVGAYQLHVSFNGGGPAPPPVPVPTPTPPPAPPPAPIPVPVPIPSPTPTSISPDRYEPNGTTGQATSLGTITQASIAHLSIFSGSDVDVFTFRAARAGVYRATAPGMSFRVLDAFGRPFGQADGTIQFRAKKPGTRFYLEVSAPGGVPVADYGLSIALQGTGSPARQRAVHQQSTRPAAPAGHHPAGPRALLARTERF